ncbi:chemotaxis response regulator protein-glutamate methylesterase [Ruminococcaceae bacterium OttesenSCG-928-O06]|nr:chemotaxis response regulator protein-glutamate methylesterase [Ruminococcaceae bacterium OttesenSCG-928-O06]
MAPIRVMLVDDSPLFVAAMKSALEKEANIQVAGTAGNGQDALQQVPSVRPDVIICDVQMPRMSGIEFVKELLKTRKIPVVVISGTPGVTLAALAAGAVDFIPKPEAGEARDAFFKRMITTIRVAASANVGAKTALRQNAAPHHAPSVFTSAPADVVVAIGASTGGTDAIAAVIRNFPASFPGVLITQHMPAGFTAMYAERLDRECKMQVREVKDGDRLQKGLILLAAGDKHLRLRKDQKGYYASSRPGMKVNGHMPSVDVLFESVAEVAGARAAGVILTGMGGDGAEGLLKMRKAGAYTIGQDKESSVVYGMPMMAYNKGAVTKQLPLEDIANDLISHMNKMR